MQCLGFRHADRAEGSGLRPVTLERLHDSASVWGDEWLHAGSTLIYETLGSHGRPDSDELVFFIPGINRDAMKRPTLGQRLGTRMSPSEAMANSMRTRINAAYFAPELYYMHDQFAVAAWYGIVASGRSAWMPTAFARYICDPVNAELAAARDRVFARNFASWWLASRISSCANRVLATGSAQIVKGRALATRRPRRQIAGEDA